MIIPANDEPGSPVATPVQRRARLTRLVGALEHGADGRIAAAAIIREVEALHPGLIDREAARIQAARLGIRPLPLDRSGLDWPED